jgi:hypothetical protein
MLHDGSRCPDKVFAAARQPPAPRLGLAARRRIVLGQQANVEKSTEITAFPLLLKHLYLKGALVTMDAMDAMGTQTDITRAIRDRAAIIACR